MRLGRLHVDRVDVRPLLAVDLDAARSRRSSSAAVASSSNDSCAMTWHQWQAAYPTDSSTGTSRRRASANASAPHAHQSTGLSACCSRYGLVASARRLAMAPDRAPPAGPDTPLPGRVHRRPARQRPGDDPGRRADRAVLPLVRAGRAGRQHHRLAGSSWSGTWAPRRCRSELLDKLRRRLGSAAGREHARGHGVRAAVAAAQPGSGDGSGWPACSPARWSRRLRRGGRPGRPGARPSARLDVEEAPVGRPSGPAGPAPTTD